MSDDTFELKRVPVKNRDQSASRLFGYTWSEMGMLAGSLFLPQVIVGNGKFSMFCLVATWVFIKKIKTNLPDRFIHNMIRWYIFRKEFLFRAGARDTEWRPPLTRD
jgi:hypothetical protein